MSNIFAISCLALSCLSLILGLLVYFRNRAGLVNRTWLGVTVSAALWSLGFWGVVQAKTAVDALSWQYLLDFGAIFIPAFFFHFSLVVLNESKTNLRLYRLKYIVSYLLTIFLIILSFSPLFKTGMSPRVGFNFWVVPGPWYFVFPLLYSLLIVYTLFLLIKGYGANSGMRKYQVKYVLLALIIGFGGAATDFLPQLFNIYPYGHFFVAFYIVFITYAITRYRLMDIKSIIKKSSVFAILVIIVGSILAFFSTFLADFLKVFLQGSSYLISSIIGAVFITIIFQPLRTLLEKLTDRFLFTKSYNPSDLLAKINETTSSTIDLNKLLKLVAEDLEGVFHYSKIGFALINKTKAGEHLKVYHQAGFEAKSLEKFSKDKIDFLPMYFSGNSKEIQVIDELKAQYEANEYQPKSVELLNGLYELNISLVIPLFVKEKLIGVIVLGSKKSDDPYNSEDLKTLDIIAGQLGMAIENAKLYEEQKNFNVYLKEEVKKATEKLEAVNKELKRLDDAKSEFLSIASHQLRTPLTAVKGFVSMILEGSFGKVPPLIKTNLEKVYQASERLIGLVESLLNISRIEAGRLEFDIQPVNLVPTVQGLIEDFKKRVDDKGLKLNFYPEKNLPLCLADGQKVKEVISNMIDNSVKYTPKGEINVSLHKESQSIVFACQDTGIGVDPDDLPRLFEKFVRGKGMMQVYTEGTGLGMYFARMVVENMGGRIWAESDGKGKGSKFCFSLPMADKGKAAKVG